MDKHKECILLNELPRTFRDAVAFVKVMNVRYLWVDSLCILQDSREDKEREIPVMDQYYGNAVFNIAASAADNSDGGLFPTDNVRQRSHITSSSRVS
jgi:hypothetical protein